VAGAHGRNFEELIYRVQKGGQDPPGRAHLGDLARAESLGLNKIGAIAPASKPPSSPSTAIPRRTSRRSSGCLVMKGGRVVKNELGRR